MDIFKNEFFSLFSEDHELFIVVSGGGYDIRKFNDIISAFPAIELTNFIALKKALQSPNEAPISIGKLKSKIEVIFSKNELEAKVKLNMTKKELQTIEAKIISEILIALNDHGVTEGILTEALRGRLPVQTEIVVAKATLPIDGENAVIKHFQRSAKQPFIKKDGSVDHYDLKLIDNVKKGDWLGEKILATSGTPGKTVTNKAIAAKTGRDFPLRYDQKTVEAVQEYGKVVLRALIDGAVKFEGDKVKVQNHLMIDGDIDFNTGNINFEGSVTINGTVSDGFSVTAKNDISILSEMGIGAVEKIESLTGSIYIKGGIFGKCTAKIKAKENVFVKYCNECTITAGNNINIGFYALDSNLCAKNVLFDPDNGKIMGGNICAEVRVVTATIGNKLEKKTEVNVTGFNRLAIKQEFDKIIKDYRDLLDKAGKMKRQLEIYERTLEGAEYGNLKQYNTCLKKYQDILDQIRTADERKKRLQKMLETKGEGEVAIFKAAYPQTYLKIKQLEKRIKSVVRGNFFAKDKTLHHN